MTKKNKKSNKELVKKNTMEERQEKITYDLFDNPMTRNIMKQLSVEEIESYKKIGEELYGTIDFEKSEILNNLPFDTSESVAYIIEGLKSGLQPKDMNKDELNLMKEVYGNEWYLKYGYTEDDLK